MKKWWLFISVFLIIHINCHQSKKWYTSTLLFFDTVCELHILCPPSLFPSAEKKVYDIFSEMEDLFSPGVENYSSPRVVELFRKALEIHDKSNGCFDITVAPLSYIWGFRNGNHRIPDKNEISVVLQKIGMDRIKIKNESLLLSPGMELDWGGIAKGWGIDLASNALMRMDIPRGFINAGGDLFCWGKNVHNQPWQVGIQNPRKEGYFGVISLSHRGASTTGDYQRYFMKNGIRYHHVFDPKTGFPAKSKQSVTVSGPTTVICDALSTALFVSLHPEEIIQKFPEYGAVMVDSGGKVTLIGKTYPFRRVH